MNLVFDLDGTLIDSRQRLYTLYRQLVPTTALDFDHYWDFKRAKVSHAALLRHEEGFGDEQVAVFEAEWMARIETPEMLALDAIFPGVPQALACLARQATLHLCTARQRREPVLSQLGRLGLAPYFSTVLVTLQSSSKDALIKTHIPDRGAGDWMIGDTGKDIEVGRRLGMRTCAVLSGFLSRDSLLPYRPDLILNSATDFSLDQQDSLA